LIPKGGIEVQLSRQIKELRQRDGLSQEVLAERIYVTRQTISNWETQRSYPDVQSLLLLSVLFNVSLDELVKGDTEMMRSEIDKHTADIRRLTALAWVMSICMVIGALGMLPMLKAFGPIGIIPSVILISAAMVASFALERIKKKNDLETYTEIIAFIDGKPINREGLTREKKYQRNSAVLKVVGGAAAGILLATLGSFIARLFLG
jgi:transcriptional regulator with XRE-family HTH domain